MRLRTKEQKLEDFIAALARKGVPENAAANRTAKEAKRLGLDVDDEVQALFGKHYPDHSPAARKKNSIQPKAKANLNGTSHPLFEWRNAFRAVKSTSKKTGLPAGTRHVLLTISMFMDLNGDGAYPGQDRIAKDTGLSLNTVKTHIKLAIKRGWLRRKLNHRSKYGIGYSYVMRIPPNGGQPLTGSTHDGVN